MKSKLTDKVTVGIKQCDKCEYYLRCEECCIDYDKKELTKLKQQLAEKEKELAYMAKQVKRFNNEAQKYYEDAYCNDFQKQTKIEFAVEQLEKVKKEFNERKLEYITMETRTHIYGLRIDRINELIDNQINELKGKVEK